MSLRLSQRNCRIRYRRNHGSDEVHMNPNTYKGRRKTEALNTFIDLSKKGLMP